MLIRDLFQRDIFRPINGVVKADQLDESSVWQELEEFVVTKEIGQHLRKFFSVYLASIQQPNDPDVVGSIGVWVSGFFGSGKSHFLKVLSYLLANAEHTHKGESRKAVDFFQGKIHDALFFSEIEKAVSVPTDVILFNIDSKADHRDGRNAILHVFLKVLNEMQGYSPDHPHVAHMERHLDKNGTLPRFHEAYKKATGHEWITERDAYEFNRDEVIQAFMTATGQSEASAAQWVDNAEGNFSLTIENLAKWVKEYLDEQGPDHRLVFLVDEVGQFIGSDTHLMLNLQTIAEELGTMCQGRAWIVVTSQEDIDAVLGEMKTSKANDFSKIQGRFKTRLSLSSANVDEVIQSRLLAKQPETIEPLEALFAQKGDILKHQLTFSQAGMTLKNYRTSEDFVANYPFAPYQFQLVQKIFEAIRKAGATGMHLARGERSLLDAFQSAAKQVGDKTTDVLIPLWRFYPSIESFLDTAVKKTIDQASEQPGLEDFDIKLLQILFLIRYVDEIRGNIDNLVTLCLDQIDGDRLQFRRQIEESLQRLEKETLINRSGDTYFFLTNEERDISREIKHVDLSSGEEARLLGELIFDEVLKGRRKYRYPANKMDFAFNRTCDMHPIGNRTDSGLLVSVVSPLAEDYDQQDKSKCLLTSTTEGGHILIRLGNDEQLDREIRSFLKTQKYLTRKDDGTLHESTKKILRDVAEENRGRRERLTGLLSQMVVEADYFVAGQPLTPSGSSPEAVLDQALEYLVDNTFTKMSYLKGQHEHPEKEMQAVLRSNDVEQQSLALKLPESNPQASEDLCNYIQLCHDTSRQVVLFDLLENRYAKRPYGWPQAETALLLARLLVLGEINLVIDSGVVPLEKAYNVLTTPAQQRKTLVIKRRTADPAVVQKARNLGKTLFAEMGPDGEDPLFHFLQAKLKGWQDDLREFKTIASMGMYPGSDQINDGLALIEPLLKEAESVKFIERFNTVASDLQDLADEFHDLKHFYQHQKSTWDRLREAVARFELNRLELERDKQAAAALTRMHEILKAPSPYSLIKDADTLIATVDKINKALLDERRQQALQTLDG